MHPNLDGRQGLNLARGLFLGFSRESLGCEVKQSQNPCRWKALTKASPPLEIAIFAIDS